MSDGWLPSGAANEGQPQDAASWMGVGPLHSIDEVTEGNEVMEKRERQEGITTEQAKGRTLRWHPLLPNLRRVNEAARRSGQTRFTALLHHVNVGALERAFRRQRRAASPGVDGVTVAEYEQALESNLQHLHDRVHSGQYWPAPVRRSYIPKSAGGRRPLGIPALEDKIVQGAVAEVLSAVYEADFLGFSHGFRPGRSPHSALAALEKALMTQRVSWVLDLDIRTFFDSVDHGWLIRMLGHRIADPRILRLFGRFAARNRQAAGLRRPETFDFLGFTHYCSETRGGRFTVKRKTQAKRMVRKLKALREEMAHRMHTPIRGQHRWLCQVLRGHCRYYGVIFNYRSLRAFRDCVLRLWRKTLGARSQKGHVTWASFKKILAIFPLPEPAIHQAWHR